MNLKKYLSQHAMTRAALAFLVPATAVWLASAQEVDQQDPDWSPYSGGEGEAWFDPGDWFGDPTVSHPYDAHEYYEGYWDNLTWYQKFDFNDAYVTDYDWNEETEQWEVDTGDHLGKEEGFAYKMDFSYPDPTEGVEGDGQNKAQAQSQDSSAAQQQQSGQDPLPLVRQERTDDVPQAQEQTNVRIETNAPEPMDFGQTQGDDEKTLTGEVQGFRTVQLAGVAGYRHTHALARIALENGETAVIDLGLTELLDVELSAGDTVTLRGSKGSIGGRPVFVADELVVDGETEYLQRAIIPEGDVSGKQSGKSQSSQAQQGSSRGSQGAAANQTQQMTLEGTVDKLKSVQLPGSADSQKLVRIRFENGRAATVNLGPERSLEELDLQEGDRVRIEGTRESIGGRSIVAARSVSVAGES